MGLFGPKWKSTNEGKALSFFEDKSYIDGTELEKICVSAPLGSVRLAAYRRLSQWTFNPNFLRRAAGGVLEKFPGPEEKAGLLEDGMDRVLKDEVIYGLGASGGRYLIPKLGVVYASDLGKIADRYEDYPLAVACAREVHRRNPGDYEGKVAARLSGFFKGMPEAEVQALADENPGNLMILAATLMKVEDERERVDRAFATGSEDVMRNVAGSVLDPETARYARKRLEQYEKEKEQEKFRKAAESGNLRIRDVDAGALSDGKDIHKAFVMAREAMERHETGAREAYDEIAAKLSAPKDIERALIDYTLPCGADGVPKIWDLPGSWPWRLLSRLNDRQRLLSVAGNARTRAIRWKACRMAGGHSFPAAGNTCRCGICGFENHTIPADAERNSRYRCARCGGMVEAHPFTDGFPSSTVTYPDGTGNEMEGYNGMQADETQFARENGLL